MSVKRGGQPRPFKQKGAIPVRKSYQAALRALALDGVGHDAAGNRQKSLGGDKQGAGAMNWYGYKADRAKR